MIYKFLVGLIMLEAAGKGCWQTQAVLAGVVEKHVHHVSTLEAWRACDGRFQKKTA